MEREKLDIQAPPQWLAEKLGRSYVWTAQVISGKHGCRATDKEMEKIVKYDQLFRSMTPDEQLTIKHILTIKNFLKKRSPEVRKKFLKGIRR